MSESPQRQIAGIAGMGARWLFCGSADLPILPECQRLAIGAKRLRVTFDGARRHPNARTARVAPSILCGASSGGAVKSSRNRFSPPTCSLGLEEGQAALDAAGLASSQSAPEIMEALNEAFDVYDTILALGPKNQNAREAQRARLRVAVERLSALMAEPRSVELLNMLAVFPASEVVAARVDGRPVREERLMGSVPQHALAENLTALRIALIARTWDEEPEPGGLTAYQHLIGDLAAVFMASFGVNATATNRGEGTKDSAFERFARAALKSAGITPAPTATTIGDALNAYRDWRG